MTAIRIGIRARIKGESRILFEGRAKVEPFTQVWYALLKVNYFGIKMSGTQYKFLSTAADAITKNLKNNNFGFEVDMKCFYC